MEHQSGRRFAIIAHAIFDGVGMRGAGAVVIENGRILGLGAASDVTQNMERVELDSDLLLAPGFVDCQVNGGAGALINDDPSASTVRAVAEAHQAFGTTSLLPTLITDAREKLERLCELDARTIPGVAGFHIEGPFINVDRRGAHPANHVRDLTPPDLQHLARLAECGACVLTLAPERAPPGAIRSIVENDVIVSLGHSNATAQCVRAAADEGATGVTHLFNAMSQMSAREPGLVGAAFTDSRLFAGVIADGEHVAATNLAIAHEIIGSDRLMLVSDAMPSVGNNTSSFQLLGRRASLAHGKLTLDDGTLAGAHLTMAEAVKRIVRLAHVPLQDALRMATRTPARFLRQESEIGVLAPGAHADLVTLDATLNVSNVWLRGAAVKARRLNEAQMQ
jgi:N-acetylglucosamine-6-phosphate deacetylase